MVNDLRLGFCAVAYAVYKPTFQSWFYIMETILIDIRFAVITEPISTNNGDEFDMFAQTRQNTFEDSRKT